MAKRPLIKPSKRILILNKKLNEFISKEDDDEMRKLEEEKQRFTYQRMFIVCQFLVMRQNPT